jgi:type I site-specific restriction-modification system R (restriction) subunit
MLHPHNLLDIVQNFTVFKENDKGQIIKIVGRYQQFRAVQKIFERLKSGKTPAEKGGVVWHTQGSGKSLTMVFLIRKMRKDPELRGYKILNIFLNTGIETIEDIDECVDYMADEEKRAEFIVAHKYFLKRMDIVLPNPAALPYVRDMKTLGFINISAKNRYRDDNLNIAGCEEKVRKLIDEYVLSMGIDPKIPPISIVAEDFDDYVVHKKSAKARASEIEHAIRFHISQHMDYDPEFYRKLSEKLEEILNAHKENWEAIAEELKTFLEEVRAGRKEEDDGLDPVIEKPFYGLVSLTVEFSRTSMRRSSFLWIVVIWIAKIMSEITAPV